MDDLLRRRRNLKGKLTRTKNKIESHEVHSLDVDDTDILNEQLVEIWTEFNELSDEIMIACADEDMEVHEQAFSEITDRYYEALHTLKGIVRQMNSGREPTCEGSDVRRGGQAATTLVKLPKLDLPTFDGELLKWTEFRDIFKSTVHDQILKGAVKLQYLKGALRGEAAELIKQYTVSDDNYDDAWNVLEKRYQNTKQLVRAHIQKFNAQKCLKEKSATGLRSLVDTSTACILGLKALGREISSNENNDWAIFGILEKLDNETRELWEAKLGRNVMPTVRALLDFLDDRVSYIASSTTNLQSSVKTITDKRHASAHQVSTDYKCLQCNVTNHMIYNCPEFLKLSVAQRRQVVKDKNLCYNCLRTGHGVYQCKLNRKCKKCNKNHNTLLHIDAVEESPKQEFDSVTAHMSIQNDTMARALFATALVAVVDASGGQQYFRALLDPGADVSFITENAVQLLGVPKQKTSIKISGLGANSVGSSKGVVKIQMVSELELDFKLDVDAYVVSKVTDPLPKAPLTTNETRLFKGIKMADPQYSNPGRIDFLLGADVVFDIFRDGRITTRPGLPVGMNTVWGYVIGGRCPSQSLVTTVSSHHVQVEETLDATLRRFWELEQIPSKRHYSAEDRACEEHFISTHRRNNTGRYVVKLPFREKVPELGSSLPLAIKRLKMMERQLSSKPERKKQYIEFMREYEKLGHMEKIPENEITRPDALLYYFPHHPVIRDESISTKLRVVFDGSAKSTTKVSLNEKLMTGPKLQDDLFHILVRFRLHNICLKADICKMYRQILVEREDCDFQRIVWRESPTDPISHYRLLTVTYGTSVAPYIAKRCLQQLTVDEATTFPEACAAASKDFYMDDLMSGESNKQKAITQQQSLFELLKAGGFELRKWTSNSVEVIEVIPDELRETQVPFRIDETERVKTLGIFWNPQCDEFLFKVNLPKQSNPTKRLISSANAKVFDPLGWISPVTIVGKILLQDIWRCKADWDECIFGDITQKWEYYRDGLKEKFKIPRRVYDELDGKFELLGFSDASQKAYAAVVYLRSKDHDGAVSVKMLAAKSRVAPVKQVSLPRLELCGAVLLVQLIDAVTDAMQIKPEEVHAWTDSTVVLEWLKSSPSRWDTFVANRVALIQESIPSTRWHHVPGVENPADCGSRGITPNELITHSLWWTGPEWLHEFSTDSYQSKFEVYELAVAMEEKRQVAVHYATIKFDFAILHSYSSLPKILRITANCLRFTYNLRNKTTKKKGPLTVKEILDLWVKLAQVDRFEEDIVCLVQNKPLMTKSRIAVLNPYIDGNGLVRVGGRLKNSKIDENRKHPILLPKSHRLTELLIKYEHEVNLHAEVQLLLATLQRKYWIMGSRDIVRYWVRKCVKCCKLRENVVNQQMGNLPEVRVNPERPFLNAGVDYAGPITLRAMEGKSKKQYKGYIAIFVCMVTKAVHLEVVRGLTTQAFMATFRRFIGRRGKCLNLYSDCGRTFIGAQKELRILNSKVYNDSLVNALSNETTQFHFNPPGAPHFGGLWEVGIKSVKYHLRRVMGNMVLDYEEMQTLLIQIEACLNSRPISALSRDPEDLQPLTPGHFLIGDALTALPDRNYTDSKVTLLNRWQKLQRTFQDFWRRWSKEYLTR